MSDRFDKEIKLIYSDDEGVEITKIYFPNMAPLSYVIYDDDELSISIEYTSLFHKEGVLSQFNEMLLNNDIDEFLIKATKNYISIIKEQYEKGVKQRKPDLAFLYHNKRDLARQIDIALDNHIFDELTMYEYICKSYSTVECGKSYSMLFERLQELKEGDFSEEINAKLKESLSSKIIDGYLEIYRGINERNRENGLSYTLSLKVAKFFANRWDDEGVVKKYRVHIDDIVAYITDRGEDEILTDKAEYLSTVDIHAAKQLC